jgi:hypothetical protein
MRLDRLRPADWATGFFGLLLLVAMFSPWYKRSDGGVSGWASFTLLSAWLAILIALALAVPLMTMRRESPTVPVALDVITAAVGIVAIPFVVARQFLQPGPDAGIDFAWGSVFGLVCVLGVTVSAWRAIRDQRSPGLKPAPAPEPMPAPPRA